MAASTRAVAEDMSVSDSDAEEAEEEEEEALEARAAELEAQLGSGAGAYEAHMELIDVLSRLGELQRLRTARERASAQFPLSERLWLKWLDDELRLVSLSGVDKVYALFRRATQDYLSVKVWLRFLEFVKQHLEQLGAAAMEQVLTPAATLAGFHLPEGGPIWPLIAEIVDALTQSGQVNTDATESMLLLQASCPGQLVEVGVVKDEQKRHEIKVHQTMARDLAEWSKPHEAALLPFERPVRPGDGKAGANLTRAWLEYLNDMSRRCKRVMNKSAVQRFMRVLHERSVASCCLERDVWIAFADFAQFVLKDYTILGDVVARALRNVPQVPDLWSLQIQLLEHQQVDQAALVAQVGPFCQRAMSCSFASPEDYADVLLTACNAYRRFSLRQPAPEASQGLVRAQFEFTLAALQASFPNAWNARSRVVDEFCRCLINEKVFPPNGSFLDECFRLWKTLLDEFSTRIPLIHKAISFFAEHGDLERCRKLFKLAFFGLQQQQQGNSSALFTLAKRWVELESRSGNLEDLDNARAQLASFRSLVSASAAGSRTGRDSAKKRKGKDGEREDGHMAKKKKRAKPDATDSVEPSSAKNDTKVVAEANSRKQVVARPAPETHGIFAINLSYKSTQTEIKEHMAASFGRVQSVRLKLNKSGKSRGICTVLFKDPADAEKAIEAKTTTLDGRLIQISRARAFDPSGPPNPSPRDESNDDKVMVDKHTKLRVDDTWEEAQRSAYVGRIPTEYCTEEALRSQDSQFSRELAQCGSIEAVRVASNKCSAVVRFQEPSSREQALELDGKEFMWSNKTTSRVVVRPPLTKYASATGAGKGREATGVRESAAPTRLMVPRSLRRAKKSNQFNDKKDAEAKNSTSSRQSTQSQTTVSDPPPTKGNDYFRQFAFKTKKK